MTNLILLIKSIIFYKNNFLIRDICLIKKSIIKMRTNLIDVIYELDIKDGKN